MTKEVEMTEVKTNTFRLFNKIEYNPVTYTNPDGGEATFWVRPMKNTEKSLFDFEEQNLHIGRGVLKMIEDGSVTSDDYDIVEGERVPKEGAIGKITKALSGFEYNIDVESRYLEAVKNIVVACTEKVEWDGDVRLFNDEMYEAFNGSNARTWLLQQVKDAGELTGAERVAL
jgi:hypothetical protein